jgi:hypothetical protein
MLVVYPELSHEIVLNTVCFTELFPALAEIANLAPLILRGLKHRKRGVKVFKARWMAPTQQIGKGGKEDKSGHFHNA